MSSALVFCRARRRVAVVDAGAPRNSPAAHLHGFLSRDGLPPTDLLAGGREEVTGYGGHLLAGTLTPLHYDEHSILFTQVHGRKRFRLVPSFDRDYVYPRDKYYSDVDPDQVDPARHPLFTRASVMDLEVGPGDGLFIPVGWWHWARSLSVSISATFSSFAWPFVNTRLHPTTS